MDAAIVNLLVAIAHNIYVAACRVVFGSYKFWMLSCVRAEVALSVLKLAGSLLVLVFVVLEEEGGYSFQRYSLHWLLFATALILPRSSLILHCWLACQRLARRTVSQNRRRYSYNGFDLDLSYITERILAMGFPAKDLEAKFRNPLSEVRRFLNQQHPNHRVYNLCREPDRRYDESSFKEVSTRVCFYDHTPCPLEQLLELVEDQHRYLASDASNVVAIHCKAGKGRTGLVCASLLLREGLVETAGEALSTYADRRTHNQKGVTIPSQIRYVHYYEQCLRERALRKQTCSLESVCLENVASLATFGRCSLQVQVKDADRALLLESAWVHVPDTEEEDTDSELESSHLQESALVLELGQQELPTDLQVVLRISREEFCSFGEAIKVLCSFWLNTGYVTREMRLRASDLDLQKYWKKSPIFDADFCVVCCFQCSNLTQAKVPFYEVTEEEFERLWLSGAVDGASEVEDEVYEISEEDFDRLLKAGQLQLARLEAMDNDASALDHLALSSLPMPLAVKPLLAWIKDTALDCAISSSEAKKAGNCRGPWERRGLVVGRCSSKFGEPSVGVEGFFEASELGADLEASISGSVVPLTEAEEEGETRVARRLPANGRLPRISLPNTWEALRKSSSCVSGTDAGGESDLSSPSPAPGLRTQKKGGGPGSFRRHERLQSS
ncbi:pteN [Symbiodinium natans]|uniref:PteN protein n=1 Tax=Symbiodinium natans TaxID=878477 RepID=A0A812J919_9DINO|nr:pteN [Symbiodinium natans]